MTDQLYFNGIRARTGTYGLSPMTPQSLTQHVLDALYEERTRMKALEEELRRRHDTDDKILQVVQLLVEDNLRACSDPACSVQAWVETLAERLAPLLFGRQGARPGDVAELAHQLSQDPTGTVLALVKGLSRGFSKDVAELLLGQPPDDQSTLKENLKRHFEHQLHTLKAGLLSRALAERLRTDAVARAHWQRSLTDALRRLPVASLQVLAGDLNLVIQPMRRLISELATSGQVISHGTHIATWIRELNRIADLGRAASWSILVESVDQALSALSESGDRVTWGPLLAALNEWLTALLQALGHQGVVEWVDATQLQAAGWGIIFPAKMDTRRLADLKAQLAPLLAWREGQAGRTYRLYESGEGYRPNESATSFLQRHGARAADPANPEYVPYYLLLIGSPEEIPFEFQYQLDVQYAVGRLDFGDDLEAYRHYAENVVAAESEHFEQDARAVFFAVQNTADAATADSSQHLVQPLLSRFRTKASSSAWQIDCITAPHSTKATLLALMQQARPPAFVFTASHGVEFDAGDPQQRAAQGALLCHEWNGTPGMLPKTAYVSANDITPQTNLQGAILFLFACYGAGTPRYDEYYRQAFKKHGTVIADPPFVAALPQALLGMPQRGPLAIIGHVDRAWGMSFLGNVDTRPAGMAERRHEYVDVYESAIERLLKGHPVGSALEHFNMRYAALSTELASLYETIADQPTVQDAYQLAELWTATNDARGMIILGDPAVRLRAAAQAGLNPAPEKKANA